MKIPMRGFYFLFIFVLFVPLTWTQSKSAYNAKLLFKEEKTTKYIAVIISQDDGVLEITARGNEKPLSLSLPFSQIKRVDYIYTQKPQILEGLGTTAALSLLTGGVGIIQPVLGLPYFLSKKKTHWLVFEIEKESLVLQLQKKDYRQLLFEMRSNGIKVEDSGKQSKSELVRRGQP